MRDGGDDGGAGSPRLDRAGLRVVTRDLCPLRLAAPGPAATTRSSRSADRWLTASRGSAAPSNFANPFTCPANDPECLYTEPRVPELPRLCPRTREAGWQRDHDDLHDGPFEGSAPIRWQATVRITDAAKPSAISGTTVIETNDPDVLEPGSPGDRHDPAVRAPTQTITPAERRWRRSSPTPARAARPRRPRRPRWWSALRGCRIEPDGVARRHHESRFVYPFPEA